jgi:NAD+ kinase
MPEKMPVFQRIAVAAHPRLPGAAEETERVASFIEAHGLHVVSGLIFDDDLQYRLEAGEFDILIALGGDGTMLRAGRMCAPCLIPVLGINLGRFGFLTELRQNLWQDYLPRLFSGEYWLEHRMMLFAEHFSSHGSAGSWSVLNEVVVGRGMIMHPVHLIAHVDGRFLTTYVADALIAATPTGSTAYALAAGGPILPPELRNILLLPVAPHLSLERAIVLAEGSSVSITIDTSHDVILSIDGQASIELHNDDRVDVRAGDHTALFVRFQDPGYFYRNLTPHMNQNPSTGINRNHDR